MKFMLYIMAAGVMFFIASGAVLSWFSREGAAPGRLEGRLQPCPATPNCVCSEWMQGDGYVEPLRFEGDAQSAWVGAQAAVRLAGGEISRLEGDYLAATFKTPLFRFVDDVELRLDEGARVIHIRSASRVGRSDLGTNRKRVAHLRHLFSTGTLQ